MSAKSWDTVAIVGVGLLGGSIGLALRERGLAKRVVGVGRNADRLKKAVKLRAISRGVITLAEGVADADLIVVCTPVEEIVDHIRAARAVCREDALLTDVGSTKASIVAALSAPPRRGQRKPRGTFIGSHPIAGSDKSGAENARGDLFNGRSVVITPTTVDVPEQVARLEKFWESLGAKVTTMTATRHDEACAAISHLPHAVASILAAVTPAEYLPLVAGGWLDTTRVAAGDVELWRQIFMDNRQAVAASLRDFSARLVKFRDALNNNDSDAIVGILEAGKKNRDAVGN